MPGGTIYNITNSISKYAKSHPQYYLITIILMIVLLMILKRAFELNNQSYYVFSVATISVIGGIIILSSILYAYSIKDSRGYIESLNIVFNSQGARNFLAVILLILFIMYIYEVPMYGNNDKHFIANYVEKYLGIQTNLSNKTVGIGLIFFIGLFTAYGIMVTTNDVLINQ